MDINKNIDCPQATLRVTDEFWYMELCKVNFGVSDLLVYRETKLREIRIFKNKKWNRNICVLYIIIYLKKGNENIIFETI